MPPKTMFLYDGMYMHLWSSTLITNILSASLCQQDMHLLISNEVYIFAQLKFWSSSVHLLNNGDGSTQVSHLFCSSHFVRITEIVYKNCSSLYPSLRTHQMIYSTLLLSEMEYMKTIMTAQTLRLQRIGGLIIASNN